MAMQLIPSHWVVRRSTPFFTRQNVPQALLTHHNTAAGVFGQLCVMEGTVTYHGFADEQAEEPEVSLVIRAGEFATSPPQYWHRVELSEDARFNIHFWAEQAESDQPLFNSRKAKASTMGRGIGRKCPSLPMQIKIINSDVRYPCRQL